MKPIVSVILVVFNGSEYLREAIQSVLKQSYTDFELLIINDGSTDNSQEMISSFKDSRIKPDSLPHQGLVQSLNYGISISKGKYIARIDADDYWEQNKLEIQIKYLDKNPHVVLLGTARKIINSDGKVIICKEFSQNIEASQFRELLGCYNFVCHSSVIFSREVIDSAGVYSNCFRYCEDYDFWIRINKNHKACLLADPLVRYRVHPNMLSLTHIRVQTLSIIRIKIRFFLDNGFKKKYLRYLIYDVGRLLLPKFFAHYRRLLRK